MTGRRFVVLAVAAAACLTLYGMYELAPPAITIVSGAPQYLVYTPGERFDKSGIVLEGEIQSVRIKTFREESTETDVDGNESVFETRLVPRTEITIRASEVFKDNYGMDSDHLTVYDRDVKDAIGEVNGVKARYVSQNFIEYKVGSRGIFFIENDQGLWIHGFTSFYEIRDGEDTVKTEFDRKYGHNSTELSDLKDTVKLKSKEIRGLISHE